MNTVRQLLTTKNSNICSVSPQSAVYDALKIMADKDIGALLVLENDSLVGIFSERDYARKVMLKGKSSKDTAVGELMVKNVVYVSPKNKIEECMALMTDKRVRHLPVLEDGTLVGLVSIGDIVKEVISEQEYTIKELEKYIQGGY